MHHFVSVTLSKRQHVFGPVCGWAAQLQVICSLGTSLCQTYPNLSPSLEPNSCIPYPSLLSETTPLLLSPGDWFPLLYKKKPCYLIYCLCDTSMSQVSFVLRRTGVLGFKFCLTNPRRMKFCIFAIFKNLVFSDMTTLWVVTTYQSTSGSRKLRLVIVDNRRLQ
jgi:hypothetical protein